MLVTELKPEIYVFIKCCELSGLCLHNNLFVADNFKEISNSSVFEHIFYELEIHKLSTKCRLSDNQRKLVVTVIKP